MGIMLIKFYIINCNLKDHFFLSLPPSPSGALFTGVVSFTSSRNMISEEMPSKRTRSSRESSSRSLITSFPPNPPPVHLFKHYFVYENAVHNNHSAGKHNGSRKTESL